MFHSLPPRHAHSDTDLLVRTVHSMGERHQSALSAKEEELSDAHEADLAALRRETEAQRDKFLLVFLPESERETDYCFCTRSFFFFVVVFHSLDGMFDQPCCVVVGGLAG